MAQHATIRRIGVMTGGGDCPGLNAVIRAVVKTSIHQYGLEVHGVFDGFLGLIEDHVEPLTFADASNIIDRGGTILGTSNKADPARFAVGKDAAGKPIFADVRDRAMATLEKHGLEALICIGGDGTMSGASRLAQKGARIVGVPKTIDNDLVGTDVTFGFDTAVSTATQAMDKVRTTASSHHRVMVVETMGRYAGWIALWSGAAAGADVILIPEIEFDYDKICDVCLRRGAHRKAYTLIAAAEGARPVGGSYVVDRVVHESPDKIRLGGVSEVLADEISRRTHLESRAVVLGHVQRGGTPTAHDRVLGTEMGHRAVQMALEGAVGRMLAMQGGKMTSVPLEHVADKVKTVPLDHPLLDACRATGASFGI